MLQRTNIFTMLHLSDNKSRYSKGKNCPCACHADAATLTEVFPCFFLGCKANARV